MSNTPTLTLRQKKQITLLYHFASYEYLQGLKNMVDALINGQIEPLLDQAKADNRDVLLTDERWGARNTSQNWSNNAWPFLKDMQQSIAKDLALRAVESYDITGVSQNIRGMKEYSMLWASAEEEETFEQALAAIYSYASELDDTCNHRWNSYRWDDFIFDYSWQEYKDQFKEIPEFKVRPDVTGTSGSKPARTGVYLPIDVPYGTPQFAWSGQGTGHLQDCNTFNQLALEALTEIGLAKLWQDDVGIVKIANQPQHREAFKKCGFDGDELTEPDCAREFICQTGFTRQPCQWVFVEMVNASFENVAELEAAEAEAQIAAPQNIRIAGGELSPKTGYYFTPAHPDSRQLFKQGSLMPEMGNAGWATIWQWDTNQG